MKKPEIKSEGQRRFLEVDGTEDELAAQVGLGRAIVGHWRRGARLPGVAARYKLEALFGIPPRAWDVEPGAQLPTAEKKKTTRSDKISADDDTLEIARMQLVEIREALQDPELTDTARLKLRDTAAKLLALRSRLERDRVLLEDRIVREHPEWQRLKAAMLKALEPYPEAAAAIIEAIS